MAEQDQAKEPPSGSGEQHRAIWFIGQLNTVGYRPSATEIEQWLDSPAARAPTSAAFLDLSALVQLMARVKAITTSSDSESVTEHLVRIGWAAAGAGTLVDPWMNIEGGRQSSPDD